MLENDFRQLSLEVWKNEYSYPFLELNNIGIKDAIFNYQGSFVLIGDKFSGKKHLAFKIMKMKRITCYFANIMSDSEIISLYDLLKTNKESACWIVDNDLSIFSLDVQSRLRSLSCFCIKKLDLESLKLLLIHRLSVIGLILDEQKIKYCIERLDMNYSKIEDFIKFIKGQSFLGLKELKSFFDKY